MVQSANDLGVVVTELLITDWSKIDAGNPVCQFDVKADFKQCFTEKKYESMCEAIDGSSRDNKLNCNQTKLAQGMPGYLCPAKNAVDKSGEKLFKSLMKDKIIKDKKYKPGWPEINCTRTTTGKLQCNPK